jgi:uncharacterized protein YutE (UPF0331/DUF86 family)
LNFLAISKVYTKIIFVWRNCLFRQTARVADDELGEVNWYSDIPRILAQDGYIDSETEEMWVSMIGFRNVLVHQYADIDRQIVYDVLQNQLEAFQILRHFFAQFI